MSQPPPGLPPDVAEALARGELIEAIKRLRGHGVEGLEAVRRSAEARRAAQSSAPPSASGATPASTPTGPFGLGAQGARGARRRARRATWDPAKSVGQEVDLAELQRRGLSPGEVPRASSAGWGVVVVLLIGYLVFRLLR